MPRKSGAEWWPSGVDCTCPFAVDQREKLALSVLRKAILGIEFLRFFVDLESGFATIAAAIAKPLSDVSCHRSPTSSHRICFFPEGIQINVDRKDVPQP